MRALWVGLLCVGLAACQTTTQTSLAAPDTARIESDGADLQPFESQAVVSERRLKINACLADIGLAPLPEAFGETAPPMTLDQSEVFEKCMARAG